MATLEQKRAAFALARIDELKDLANKGKFRAQLLKLPARLHTNGLGQTVAFYLSAGPEEPQSVICGWIGTWLVQREIYQRKDRLIDSITGQAKGMDPALVEPKYREAAAEVRALAVWLKRFAEAFIAEEASD